MRSTGESLLRAIIRETLKASDVALSKQPTTLVDPFGPSIRVELNGETWLTRSRAEVSRVLAAGGRIVKERR